MDASVGQRTTASMLAEITCGTAAELVMAVRYTNAPPGPTFIPTLDDALKDARGNEQSTLKRGDMIEIIGASGSGKTSLALFLILTRILPTSVPFDLPSPNCHAITLDLGGKADHAVLLVPTSHRSPLSRLTASLRDHITHLVQEALSANLRPRRITPALSDQIEAIVMESLSRLRIVRFKPRWTPMFLALKAVLYPPRLELDPGTEMTERLDLVVVDGFGDPFWPERWATWGKDEAGGQRKPGRVGEQVGMKEVMGMLESMRREMGAVVVLTIQGLWPDKDSPFYATHLPPPFPRPFQRERDDSSRTWPLNVQIVMQGRVRPHQFPADMTLVDALRALEVRTREEDAAQVFEGHVRVSGAEETMAGSREGVRFELRIGEHGVEV